MVATPNVVAIKAPQVFQGTSDEVIVPASSTVRDKFLSSKPLSLYAWIYILPGKRIDKYWSHAITFAVIEEAAVVAIKLPVERAKRSNRFTIVSSAPVNSRI